MTSTNRRSAARQAEQDGSEVKSVELERLIAQGISLIERRNAFEFVRDHAAELYEAATGSAWRPHTGSMVNHRALTAAVIDSREFLAARRRADAKCSPLPAPASPSPAAPTATITPASGTTLDKIRTKHPDMVLLHGGSPRGAERIAACWADHRKVPQVVFKPDWTRDRNAAPFKRNDRMLEALPIGVVVFPGSGIAANLADKAKKLGIPTWRFDKPAGPRPKPRAAPLRRRRILRKPTAPGYRCAVDGSRLTTCRRSGSAAFTQTPCPACRQHWLISSRSRTHCFRPVIPEIDIWRAALLMLKRFGDNAPKESAARADNLETEGDRDGAATWRRITDAVEQLANPTPTGPVH